MNGMFLNSESLETDSFAYLPSNTSNSFCNVRSEGELLKPIYLELVTGFFPRRFRVTLLLKLEKLPFRCIRY